MRFMSLTAFFLAIGFATAALADDREALKEACIDDYRKYCLRIMPGGGRVKRCFEENETRLTERCRIAWASERARKAK